MSLKKKSLSSFTKAVDKFTWAPNQISTRRIIQLSNIPLIQTLPENLICAAEKTLSNGNIHCLISLGRLSPEKNHRKMIEAFKLLVDSGSDAVLFIVGEGPLRESLSQQVMGYHLTDRVFFTGRIENPFPLLRAANALVLTSDYEGLPMALLEALCLQVPYIAVDSPGTGWVWEQFGGGCLAEGTPSAIAAGIRRLLATPFLNSKFDGNAYAEDAINCFTELLE